MTVLYSILICLLGFVLLALIFAAFFRKNHFVKREILVEVSSRKAFDFIRFLKNQDKFNTGAMAGERQRDYRGTDGTVGFVYAWKGDKNAGEGEKEIKKIEDGKCVEMEIRFIKPMKMSSYIVMDLEAVSAHQTKISWSNAGTVKYPLNIFIPMFEKMIPKGMDQSLITLKNILETQT